MTNEELVQLVQDGIDVKANMNLLYKQNKGIMLKLVRHRTDVVNDLDDLMQQAYLALYRAAMLFNSEEMQCSFVSTLRFHVLNELRKNSDLPVYMQSLVKQYNRVKFNYENEFNSNPSREYLCKQLNIKDDVLTRVQACATPVQSLDIPVGEEGTTELYELIPDSNSTSFDERIENEELSEILRDGLDRLSDKEKDIIIQEFYYNKTLDNLSKKYEVSRERVRQIRQNGFNKLKKNGTFIKNIQAYRDDLIPIRHVGVSEFNRNNTSSVEWSVLKMERMKTDETIARIRALHGW